MRRARYLPATAPQYADATAGTALLLLENVCVGPEALLGPEGVGFRSIMANFNHERWSIAVQALRFSRCCIEESIRYGRRRKTFGAALTQHQVIRHKIAEMARQVIVNPATADSQSRPPVHRAPS
jgi:acyl-CoA dehydrogenase